MTEKRFYNDGKYVMQNGGVYVVCGGEHSADVVATALNELLEENKQLKEKNATIKGKIINAMIESNKVECSCNPCVCEQYVKKELMRD